MAGAKDSVPTISEQIQTVALHMNKKLHNQAKKVNYSFLKHLKALLEMNLATSLENIAWSPPLSSYDDTDSETE